MRFDKLLGVTAICVAAAVGAGNDTAEKTGSSSPLVVHARQELLASIRTISDPRIRKITWDGLANTSTCIAHRANLNEEAKKQIIEELVEQRLLNPADAVHVEGMFPPVLDDGTSCPHLPLSLTGAAGSEFGGHHSYPGGLAVHEAMNQRLAESIRRAYLEIYGADLGSKIDRDVLLAAAAWHDWAKLLVFQWNADGTEFNELKFGGTGTNDDFGMKGDSRTGAHHILSLAETMARGLPPLLVITQASAHAAPTLGNQYRVINWLRAAAIIARIDPVARGYLVRGEDDTLRLPSWPRGVPEADLLKPATPFRIEFQIHNLSDGDFVNSVPAASLADLILRVAAPKFGYNAGDTAAYNNRFRNVVLARVSAERLEVLYTNAGMRPVLEELAKLRRDKVI